MHAPPPDSAQVLFDGTTLDAFSGRSKSGLTWLVEDGVLIVDQAAGDLYSRDSFGDCRLHLEWLSPAGGAGQLSGNSGIKLQGRYEIQILNSPGEPHVLSDREAGAIYAFKAPDRNASTGADAWQSYDIWFTAPRWEGDQKVADATITLFWNGVLVHDRVEVPGKTGASDPEGPDPAPLLLQAHASDASGPVRFRNMWIVRDPAPPPVTEAQRKGRPTR
ncbi:MAG: DUF1080 domain-containing protein [Phycisphaerales bacterium]